MVCFYGLNVQKYSVHEIVLQLIQPNNKILELGCCTGYISKRLLNRGCSVWGVDNNRSYLSQAKKYCKKTFLVNLEHLSELKLISQRKFDYILLMDVLEHLRNPRELLFFIKKNFIVNNNVIISIPNVANISVRLSLLFGRFKYTEFGLLDRTHIKFYTLDSAKELLTSAGLKIDSTMHSTDLGLVPFFGRLLRKLPKEIQYFITKIRPTLLAGQFIFVCSI